MEFTVPIEITKNFILSSLSEEEIFERYGVEITNDMFCSPLRVDKNPTCSLKRVSSSGRLYMRDWAGHFWGDCFDFIMAKYGISFGETLRMIAQDFGLIEDGTLIERTPKQVGEIIKTQAVLHIKVENRQWNHYDAVFWKQYGITSKDLEKFNIVPVNRLWLDGNLNFYYHKPSSIVYAYCFPGNLYKIYFPYRDKKRFIQNSGVILQGEHMLHGTYPFILITKSYKDVVKFSQYNIPAVAPMSEGQVLTDKQIERLMQFTSKLFVMYDNDMPGKRSMVKYRKINITPIMIPNGQPKDITDYYKKYGQQETDLLIKNAKNYLL